MKKRTFRSYLAPFEPAPPPLPIFHTTTQQYFRDIICSDKKVHPKECKVFREPLLYLFYGRPGYKVQPSFEGQLLLDQYYPVALLFEPSVIRVIKRVFPFDTGAFNRELYRPFLHEDVTVTDFQVEPSIEAAGRIVRAFFETNSNYVVGRAFKGRDINSFSHPEAHAHLNIIATPQQRPDDRRYSIEIQTSEPIDLCASLRAIIMPQIWLELPEIRDFLKAAANAEMLTYFSYEGTTLDGLHGAIFHRAVELLDKGGFLKGEP